MEKNAIDKITKILQLQTERLDTLTEITEELAENIESITTVLETMDETVGLHQENIEIINTKISEFLYN